MKASILLYHIVSDDLPPSDVTIGTDRFVRQMKHLHSRGYKCIGLREWIDNGTNSSKGKHAVILTFDDGFSSVYEKAWPTLKELGFPFTVFLVSDRIGGKNDWNGIERGRLSLLNQDQIHEMAAGGVEFGGHSCTHPSFEQSGRDSIAQEVAESRNQLSPVLGKPPSFFSYPYGEWSRFAAEIAKKSEYEAACSTVCGRNSTQTDLYHLRRVYISGNDSWLDFLLKVRWGRGLFSWKNLKASIKSFLH